MSVRSTTLVILLAMPSAGAASPLSHAYLAPELDGFVPDGIVSAGPVAAEDLWDPLGVGCIAPEEPSAWLADGSRDPGAGVLCVPEPCEEQLTREDLEVEVVGRPLREDEWETYLFRLAEACAVEVRYDGETGLDLVPADASGLEQLAVLRDLGVASGRGAGVDLFRGAAAAGGFSGFDFGSGHGPSPHPRRKERNGKGGSGDDPFDPGWFEPTPDPGDDFRDWPHDPPAPPPGGDGGATEPPLPVPAPATLLLLITACAALRLPRLRRS